MEITEDPRGSTVLLPLKISLTGAGGLHADWTRPGEHAKSKETEKIEREEPREGAAPFDVLLFQGEGARITEPFLFPCPSVLTRTL